MKNLKDITIQYDWNAIYDNISKNFKDPIESNIRDSLSHNKHFDIKNVLKDAIDEKS